MSEDLTPTLLLQQLQNGSSLAAQRLWDIYFGKLVDLARRRLQGRIAVADGEDIALSAFRTFCRGMKNHRYPQLDNREDLWRLLVTITLSKAMHAVRDETRQKRGGLWNRLTTDPNDAAIVSQLADREPTPELAAQVAEEYERLLKKLSSAELIELAVMKMEGYTNEEIAKKWGKAERTVERKLQLIRQLWQRELTDEH